MGVVLTRMTCGFYVVVTICGAQKASGLNSRSPQIHSSVISSGKTMPSNQWLLRAAWVGQELLSTFSDSLGELALIPESGGIFEVRVDGEVIWSRARDGGFPEIKELKQRVRDRVDPTRDLGHSDRS